MKIFLAVAFISMNLSLWSQNNDHVAETNIVVATSQLVLESPVVVDDHVETIAGVPLNISPLLNDIGNDIDTLAIFGIISVKKGRLSDISDSAFTYTSYTNGSGVDSLRYMVRDYHDNIPLAEGKIYIDIVDHYYYDSLEVNNINAGVNASGTLFSRIEEHPYHDILGNQSPHFRYPAGDETNTIFNTSLWIGGMDATDSLHLAAQRYKQVGFDFQPGPISNLYNEEHYLAYGRTWKISREGVEHHRNNFWKEGYEPVEPIASWPGNGDPGQGEASQLAPFHDTNNDGIYDPMDGDYPLIRGDQTIFIMFNDDRVHGETQGGRMRTEIHAMVYGYDDPGDTALHNTVFVHYDLYNRSQDTYNDTYVGFFTDLEIGYGWDDYVGSDVERGTFYAFNGREEDGHGEPSAYGENPPAQSVTVLAGPFIDADGQDNPAGGCDESVNGLNFGNGMADDERYGLTSFMYFNSGGSAAMSDPYYYEDYYLFMKGLWKDNTALMYGGNGHPTAGAVGPECRYMFPGSSDPLNWGTWCVPPNEGYNQEGKYWTDEESGNLPYDRRGLGAMGPFTFVPGEIQEIEMAFVVGRGNDGPASSVDQMMRQIDSLIAGVNEGRVIVPNNYLSVEETGIDRATLNIYPNPVSDLLHITLPGSINTGDAYIIYNMQGTLIASGELDPGNNTLNVKDYRPGLYFVMVRYEGRAFAGKFLKI